MFKWIKGLFKRQRHSVKITLHPLQGMGADRKAALKFVKKWFKKCTNFSATIEDIKTTRTQGNMIIYAKIPASRAKKIKRLENKLGVDVEISYDDTRMSSKAENKAKHYNQQGLDWVISAS